MSEPATQLGAGERYCISCGETIRAEAELCPECGVRQDPDALSAGGERYCHECRNEVAVAAELCPDCGAVFSEAGGAPATGGAASPAAETVPDHANKPDAKEAFDLMVSYYQAHPKRTAVHAILVVLTGGTWLTWFGWFWFGTVMGWHDTERLRRIHQAG